MICPECNREMLRWQPAGAAYAVCACPGCGRRYDPVTGRTTRGDLTRVRAWVGRGGAA